MAAAGARDLVLSSVRRADPDTLTIVDFFLIPAAALLAPLAARGLGGWVRIPIVVFELILGIIIGPSLLGWVGPTEFMDVLSELGLAMLFFVAGTEIEFAILRGRTGTRAVLGWILSLIIGVGVGWILAPGEAAVVIGIALASTAVGTILPILRDAGEMKTPFGKSVLAIGALGEFGPLVAISIFLGTRNPESESLILLLFVVIAAGAIALAFFLPRGALHRFVESSLHTSGQFAIRVILLIIGALVVLSMVLDIDILLGAFAAGVVWSLLIRDASPESREAVESKVEAIAFGFLVPLFFIYTGVTFDLQALIDRPQLWLLVGLVVLLLLVVRGLPSMLAAPLGATAKDKLAIVFFGATGLPIIVAVSSIGVDRKIIPPDFAPVLVAGGMISVLLFPLIALTLRGDALARQGADIDEEA